MLPRDSRERPGPAGRLALTFCASLVSTVVCGEVFLVQEGQPRGEIVLADQPARLAQLAARELQAALLRMTGAELPITAQPSEDGSVPIYVGRSEFTDRLEVTEAGLEHGAFRLVSGEHWLVLLGRDRDFQPPEQYVRFEAGRPKYYEEWDTRTLNLSGKQSGDPDVWNGDNVELLFETQTHAYYQLAINPAGLLVQADRRKGLDTRWSSGAEVAARIGDRYWSVEVRLPVAGEGQEALDPRHGVAGRMPSETYPWYFNVCRQRLRANGRDLSAFSPTGKSHFHDLLKFAELAVR